MKKLLEKDKKFRNNFKKLKKNTFILKSIFKILIIISLVRWNAFLKLKNLANQKVIKLSLSNRCLKTVNKKRFNKLTNFLDIFF
jgi:hypothetical protein